MKLNKALLPAFLLALSTSTFATNENTSMPQFIAGHYWNASEPSKPLILSRRDGEDSWSFLRNVPLFSKDVSHTLYSIHCTDKTCFAGGNFQDLPLPLLLKTDDAGKSWSYVANIASLPKMKEAIVFDTSCQQDTCLATGLYYTPDANNYPLILVSQDKGVSWRSINQINNFPKDKPSAVEHSLCEGNACIGTLDTSASGGIDNIYTTPIVSTDKGASWSLVNQITGLPQAKSLNLYTMRCKEDTCVAGGIYITPNHNYSLTQPILMASYDRGQHWTVVHQIKKFPANAFGALNQVTYNKKKWFALVNLDEHKPLLVTKHQSNRWEVNNNISGLPEKQPSFQRIACEDNYCVIGGIYTTDNSTDNANGRNEQPFFLTSDDHGLSFHRANIVSKLPAMPDAYIHDIKCKQSSCTAIGMYGYNNNKKDENNHWKFASFVLTSFDRGENWTLAQVKDMPNDTDVVVLDVISK